MRKSTVARAKAAVKEAALLGHLECVLCERELGGYPLRTAVAVVTIAVRLW